MRVKSEVLELLVPFGGGIAQSFNADAAGEAAFDRCLDEGWREERKRDGHVDLTHAAFVSCCDLPNVGHGTRQEFVKPATTSDECSDEAHAPFDPHRSNFISGNALG